MWEDRWIGQDILKHQFSRFFSISADHGKSVGEIRVWTNLGWKWRLNWIRDIFVWDCAHVDQLTVILNNSQLHREISNSRSWAREKSRLFLVRFAYEMLYNSSSHEFGRLMSYLWSVKVFPNVLTLA